jgi:hypothetical protein
VENTSSGIEEGCYEIGANNAFTATVSTGTCPDAIDTNDTAGLSHPLDPQSPYQALVDDHGRFRISEGAVGDEDTNDFLRLPLQGVALVDRVGTWYMDNGVAPEVEPNLWVASIFADGHYLAGGIDDDADCEDSSDPYEDENGNGAEYGTLTQVANTLEGTVTPATTTDTNGSCGLHDQNTPLSGQRYLFARSQVDQSMLFFPYDESFGLVLKRVPSVANSVVGAWLYDDTEADHPHLAVFFPDDVLFEVSADVGAEAGLWRSPYSVDGAELTLIAGGEGCLDTMGFASCEETEVEEVLNMTVTSTTLTLDDGDESYSLTKVSTP